jgi:rRNA maturation protein Nop10
VSRKSVKRPHPLPNYPTEPAEEYRRRVREAINLLKKKE